MLMKMMKRGRMEQHVCQTVLVMVMVCLVSGESNGQICGEDIVGGNFCCGSVAYRKPYKCCEIRSHEGALSDFVVYSPKQYTCCGDALHHGRRRCCGTILDYDPYFWTCAAGILKKRTLGARWRLPGCAEALGMHSGNIPDWAITASSSFAFTKGPQYARVNTELGDGGWCPLTEITSDGHEWIIVDLGKLMFITYITTQGRFNLGQGKEFVSRYQLQYQQEDGDVWQPYDYTWSSVKRARIFKGNVNTYETKRNRLVPPMIAKKVKLVPYSDQPIAMCLRMELFGCEYNTNKSDSNSKEEENLLPDFMFDNLTDTEESGDYKSFHLTNMSLAMLPGSGGNSTTYPGESIEYHPSDPKSIYVQIILGIACGVLLLGLCFVLVRYIKAKRESQKHIEATYNSSKTESTYYDDVIVYPSINVVPPHIAEENIYADIEMNDVCDYEYVPSQNYYSKPHGSPGGASNNRVYTKLGQPQVRTPVLRPARTGEDTGYMYPMAATSPMTSQPGSPALGDRADYFDMNGGTSSSDADDYVPPSYDSD